MRKSRFTEAQIIGMVKKQEAALLTAELCRKHFLGGIQSDAVTVAQIAKSRLLGARWPATYPPRLQRPPTMKPGEFLIITNEL